jgi:hypothetical protein
LATEKTYEKRLSKNFNDHENKLEYGTAQTSPDNPVLLTNVITEHLVQVTYHYMADAYREDTTVPHEERLHIRRLYPQRYLAWVKKILILIYIFYRQRQFISFNNVPYFGLTNAFHLILHYEHQFLKMV